jgi:hypothetical protein
LSDENVFIQVFKIVWNLGNLGQNLGKILENLQQQEILGILKPDKSSAVKLNKILGKSSNLQQ